MVKGDLEKGKGLAINMEISECAANLSDAMESGNKPNEQNNLVHGRGSNKAKHHLIKPEYADRVAGVSDLAIEKSSVLVNVDDINGLGNTSRKRTKQDTQYNCLDVDTSSLNISSHGESNKEKGQGKKKKRKKSLAESAENSGHVDIDKGELPESGSMRTLQDGTVGLVSDCVDVDTSSLNISSPGMYNKEKGQRKRKKREKSHAEGAESSGHGDIDKCELPESGSMRTQQDGTVGLVSDCVDVDTSSFNITSPGKSNKEKGQGKRKKREKSHAERTESSGHGNMDKGELPESGSMTTQQDGTVAPVSDCVDVYTSSLNISSPGKSNKGKVQGKRKKREKPHSEGAKSSGHGDIDKGELPESGSMATQQEGTVGLVSDCVDVDTSSLNIISPGKSNKEKGQGKRKKREKSHADRTESSGHGDMDKGELPESGSMTTQQDGTLAPVSDCMDVNTSSLNISYPGKSNKEKVQGKRKKREKSHAEGAESSGHGDIDKGELPESGSMVTQQDGTVAPVSDCIDVNTSSLNISSPGKSNKGKGQGKRKKREKSHAEGAESSGHGDIDKGELSESGSKRTRQDSTVGLVSNLKDGNNYDVEHASGEVKKMVEPVDLGEISLLNISVGKRKQSNDMKKKRRLNCNLESVNEGDEISRNDSLHSMGGTISAVGHLSDLQVNENSGVEKMVAHVNVHIDPVEEKRIAKRLKNKKKNIKKKIVKWLKGKEKNERSGVVKMIEHVDVHIDPVEEKRIAKKLKGKQDNERSGVVKMVEHADVHIDPGMGMLHTQTSTKKLLILDINGILVDIVSIGGKMRKFPSQRLIPQKQVHTRPFCNDFLQFCFERFHVGIWSSRNKKNLNRVLRYLIGDSLTNFLFIWDQSHCTNTGFFTLENKKKPLFLKELNKLLEGNDVILPWTKGWFNESNTLLIDDSPYKALRNSPHTAIFPQSYEFKNINSDCSLGPDGDLRVYLERVASADHVQKFVEQNPFGQAPITETNPSWKFYHKIINSNNTTSEKPVINGA